MTSQKEEEKENPKYLYTINQLDLVSVALTWEAKHGVDYPS
jgi:hypothetical protein